MTLAEGRGTRRVFSDQTPYLVPHEAVQEGTGNREQYLVKKQQTLQPEGKQDLGSALTHTQGLPLAQLWVLAELAAARQEPSWGTGLGKGLVKAAVMRGEHAACWEKLGYSFNAWSERSISCWARKALKGPALCLR